MWRVLRKATQRPYIHPQLSNAAGPEHKSGVADCWTDLKTAELHVCVKLSEVQSFGWQGAWQRFGADAPRDAWRICVSTDFRLSRYYWRTLIEAPVWLSGLHVVTTWHLQRNSGETILTLDSAPAEGVPTRISLEIAIPTISIPILETFDCACVVTHVLECILLGQQGLLNSAPRIPAQTQCLQPQQAQNIFGKRVNLHNPKLPGCVPLAQLGYWSSGSPPTTLHCR